MTGFEPYNDDQYIEVQPQRMARSIETDLQDLLDLFENSKTRPLSSTISVSKDEVVAIVLSAIRNLPDEIRQARWDLKDRAQLMEQERQRAQAVMDQVRAEASRMIEKNEIVRQSKLRAEDIIAEAQARARTMINETEDFIDAKLATFEIVLSRLLDQTQSGRENLRSMIAPRVDTQITEQPFSPEPVDNDDFMERLRHDRPLTPQPAPAPIKWGESAQPYATPAVTNEPTQGWDDEFFFDQGQI
jgi:hypothetical protein